MIKMQAKVMNKKLTPWLLVITGILFNVGSAVITHYLIGLNNQNLNQLEQQVNKLDTVIESAWRNKMEIDRKQEFLLLLLTQINPALSHASSEINEYIKQQILKTIEQQRLNDRPDQTNIKINFDTINTVSDLAKNKIIKSINQTYLEKLEIEDKQLPLKEKNSFLLTIAIFLQVTGLILVLARDFRS
jgi:hypothetical protein